MNPEEPLSLVARGLYRDELGSTTEASRDRAHAGALFAARDDQEKAQQLLGQPQSHSPSRRRHTNLVVFIAINNGLTSTSRRKAKLNAVS